MIGTQGRPWPVRQSMDLKALLQRKRAALGRSDLPHFTLNSLNGEPMNPSS